MGRLMKCFGKGIPVGCSEEAGDSDAAPFVPNDFAEDDDYPFSEVCFRFFVCVYPLFRFLCIAFMGCSIFCPSSLFTLFSFLCLCRMAIWMMLSLIKLCMICM